MKSTTLALVLATAWGTKLNSAAATSPSQHQINNHNNNSPADSVDYSNSTIEQIQLAQVQGLSAEEPVAYESSLEVRQELLRLFTQNADMGYGTTMTYNRWVFWMTLELGQNDFWLAVCSQADAYCYHDVSTALVNVKVPVPGFGLWWTVCSDYDNWTINFDEFLHMLRRMNETKSPGYFHEVFAEEGLKTKRLGRVTYETRTIFQGDGTCPKDKERQKELCGHTETTKTYKVGRSSSTTVTDSTKKTISANLGFEYGVLSAGVDASYETHFSSAVTNAEYEEYETSQKFHLSLDVPNFLFQNVITLEYMDGREQTLYGLTGISHAADAEPYRRVVTYKPDGTTVDTDKCLSGCAGNEIN